MNQLNKILKNSNINNGIWLYMLQIFNTVIPLITLPYVTRVLGAKQYGDFAIALNIINYMVVMVDYGFNLSATRKVALNNSKEGLNRLFSTIVIIKQFLLLIALIILITYLYFSDYNQTQNLVFMVLFISLIGYSLQHNWLFQGLQQMKFISIINITGRSISILLTFLLVKGPNDLIIYGLLYSISPVIGGIMSVLLALTKFKLKFVKVHIDNLVEELRDGWYVFTTSFSSKVFGSIGITFLGIFSSSSIVGIYSAINKIPTTLLMVWQPISQILYPISSKKMEKSFTEGLSSVKKNSKYIVPIFIIVALAIAIFSESIIKLVFGNEYYIYSYWIFPLLGWMIFSIVNNFMGVQILLAAGFEKEYSNAFQISICINIFLNFVLIKLFEGNGAAIAPFLSELILTFILSLKIKGKFKNGGQK
ncbi:flippase [Aerococcus viridans]|uniref:Flippase n=1 Tax=Aerococcus viridans TaxID=1377 RepID=A0A2J9PPI5_9LACT|nr:flippase [Aerococcus viridans]PNL91961.1 flippase [Aerococcus viridans]